MAGDHLQRRRVLAGLASLGTVGFAGCTGAGSDATTPTSEGDGPIRSVGFAGQHLVVTLREDHVVERLNLIDPAGATYRQQPVATGATTVRLQILAINADVSGYEHYEPGTYELVAVRDGESVTRKIELRPSLEVVDVAQYRDGDSAEDLAKLAVTVKNRGTGPTWVHAIEYRNAPFHGANVDSEDDPPIPRISVPDNGIDLILTPGQAQEYVGTLSPFTYSGDQGKRCSGVVEMTVLVDVPTQKYVEQRIRASIGGDPQRTGFLDDYTCGDISVALIHREAGE
ncbi:hypothetical protein ACKVMT_17345 [Halobacteriales archaeon Cl-PHB]